MRSKIIIYSILLSILSCRTAGLDMVPKDVDISENVEVDGYSFTLKDSWDFNSDYSDWAKGSWTFDNNNTEFRPENVIIEDGLLKLKLSKKNGDTGLHRDKPYWGGEYYKKELGEPYGRFVIRMKSDVPKGVIASFFIYNYVWADDTYTSQIENSEIDIEFVGSSDNVQLALHYIDNNTGVMMHPSAPSIDLPFRVSDDFHIWEIIWTPEAISYYVDGNLIHRNSDKKIMEEMIFNPTISMNYWVSSSVEWAGRFDSSDMPYFAQYDYVKYYSLDK